MYATTTPTEHAIDIPQEPALPPLPCPCCGQLTDSLKQYRMYEMVLFVVFATAWRVATHVACPKCMRQKLLVRMLYNLPLANVFWPIVGVWHGVMVLTSLRKGHSRAIRKLLGA
jgi:hypothetical protein